MGSDLDAGYELSVVSRPRNHLFISAPVSNILLFYKGGSAPPLPTRPEMAARAAFSYQPLASAIQAQDGARVAFRGLPTGCLSTSGRSHTAAADQPAPRLGGVDSADVAGRRA